MFISTETTTNDISLRDHFAASAMQGLLKRINSIEAGCFTLVAVDAYHMADAMLKAREVNDE